jgi:hypothetical protein
VTSCNAYENRREAQKTDEERYNEEQAAIDRETQKKLREMQQEEKMQHCRLMKEKKNNQCITGQNESRCNRPYKTIHDFEK